MCYQYGRLLFEHSLFCPHVQDIIWSAKASLFMKDNARPQVMEKALLLLQLVNISVIYSVWSRGMTWKWKLVLLGLNWGHIQLKMHRDGDITAECLAVPVSWSQLSWVRRIFSALPLSLSPVFCPCNYTLGGPAPANSLLPSMSVHVWTWPRLTRDILVSQT